MRTAENLNEAVCFLVHAIFYWLLAVYKFLFFIFTFIILLISSMSLEPKFRPNNKWNLDPIPPQESESKWTLVPNRLIDSLPRALVLV